MDSAAFGAGNDVALGTRAEAVLKKDLDGEDEPAGEENLADETLAGEIAEDAVLGDLGVDVVFPGGALPGVGEGGVSGAGGFSSSASSSAMQVEV